MNRECARQLGMQMPAERSEWEFDSKPDDGWTEITYLAALGR